MAASSPRQPSQPCTNPEPISPQATSRQLANQQLINRQPLNQPTSSSQPASHLRAGHLQGSHQQVNRQGLRTLALSRSKAAQLHWRNNLLCRNLPLVRQIAQRHLASCGSCGGAALEDLESAGIFGLARAIERFDLGHGTTLATYASPFIRGAIRQELRDHWQPVHAPRRLRELDQRAGRLQEQRRGQGLPPLSPAELEQALGCSSEQLREAEAAGRARRVLSLDMPVLTGDGSAATLLDLLAAPEPAEAQAGAPQAGAAGDPARLDPNRWLHQRLARLEPLDQLLLQRRVIEERSWRSVGASLGLSHSAARQRFLKLRAQLEQEIRVPMAKAAAMAV